MVRLLRLGIWRRRGLVGHGSGGSDVAEHDSTCMTHRKLCRTGCDPVPLKICVICEICGLLLCGSLFFDSWVNGYKEGNR